MKRTFKSFGRLTWAIVCICFVQSILTFPVHATTIEESSEMTSPTSDTESSNEAVDTNQQDEGISDTETSKEEVANQPEEVKVREKREASADAMVIVDPILRQKVAEILGVDENRLTADYLSNLRYNKTNSEGYFNRRLEIADGQGITSLAGLEYFGENLTVLTIKKASLTSFAPLDQLHGLRSLTIADNQTILSDLNGLWNLDTRLRAEGDQRLYMVNLSNNTISLDQVPATVDKKLSQDVNRVSSVFLSGTQFVDASGQPASTTNINQFLSLWKNPTKLLIDKSNIQDLYFLKGDSNNKLQVLNVERNARLRNIEGVHSAVELREYYGRHNLANTTSLDVFNGLSNLNKLFISYNSILSAGDLQENNFTNLQEIYLGNNFLKNDDLDKVLSAIKSSPVINNFHMDKNMISDLSAFHHYPELAQISFGKVSFQMNNITDLSPLEGLQAQEKWVGGQYLLIGQDKYYTDPYESLPPYLYRGTELANLVTNPFHMMEGGINESNGHYYPTGNFTRRDRLGVVKSPNMLEDILANPLLKEEYKQLIQARHQPTQFYELLKQIPEFSDIEYSAETPFLQLYYRNPDANYYNGEFKKESAYLLLEMPEPAKPTPNQPSDKPDSDKPTVTKVVRKTSPKTGVSTSQVSVYGVLLVVFGLGLILVLSQFRRQK